MPNNITLPFTLTNGSTADATEVQDNLDEIVTEYNASVASITGAIVGTTASQTLTNKTLTAPIISTISNTGTITLPTSTDTLVGKATTDTLTNKRITKRVGTSASAATHTIDSDSYDVFTVTAQAEAVAFANPSGTPTQGQTLVIRIKDNGTARAITWSGSYFRAVGATLPTTTVISKTLYVGFIYNSTDTKWDCIATAQEV